MQKLHTPLKIVLKKLIYKKKTNYKPVPTFCGPITLNNFIQIS